MGEFNVGDKVLIKATCKMKENGLVEFLTDCGRMYLMSEEQAEIIVDTKTYEDGLNEAWEIVRKIHKMDCATTREVFRTRYITKVIELSPQEVAAKIAEWEEKQEIRVGDVLLDKISGNREVVVSNVHDGGIYVIWPDGSCGECEAKNFTKTGRTIDVAGLLAQIGGQNDRCNKRLCKND